MEEHKDLSIVRNGTSTNVLAAFDILLEQIDAKMNSLNSTGAEAFKAGNYEKANGLLKQADKFRSYRNKVVALREEWQRLSLQPNSRPVRSKIRTSGGMRGTSKRRGERTPEQAYYIPILQALTELGGSARVREVLRRVGQLMRPILKERDYEPLPSNPRELRWINTAKWARASMVNEGLLSNASPYGVWEITDKGRQYLERERHRQWQANTRN
jgi:hypothetical protein